jgi:hypothetical protein
MNLFIELYMLKFSILNTPVKKEVPGTLNTHPVNIKRRIFCMDKRTGEEEVLKFGQDSISHLLPQICQNSNVIRISYFLVL